MDDLPFDFTEYVSKSLGLPEEETKRLLVAWLANYEPTTPRTIRSARARESELDERVALDFRRAG